MVQGQRDIRQAGESQAYRMPQVWRYQSIKSADGPSHIKNVAIAEITETRADEAAMELAEAVGKIREHVEKNCDYVGAEFAEEARKIYYGEADERGIYGEATIDEAKELDDEGIEVMPIPKIKPNS